MKKIIIFLMTLFIGTSVVVANDNLNSSFKQQAHSFSFQDATLYASSSSSSSSAGLGVAIGGVITLIVGAAILPIGASNYYFAGLGLGWWEDSAYTVTFLNDDINWGYIGINSGVAFMIGGGVLLIAGAALLVTGILLLNSRSSLSLFIEPGDQPKTASFGFSYALPNIKA